MRFIEMELEDAVTVDANMNGDERGYLATVFDAEEFEHTGLSSKVALCNLSYNWKSGTLRGMHYRTTPESRLVRCVGGEIYNVIVDLRPDSGTYMQWEGTFLNPQNAMAVYVPRGFAHGYQTMQNNTTVLYQTSDVYTPELERGFRWDDPAFNIQWLINNPIINKKDETWPNYEVID